MSFNLSTANWRYNQKINQIIISSSTSILYYLLKNQIMKKEFISLVAVLALFLGIGHSLHAQERKIILEINSSINNTACNLDSGQRNCLLEKTKNNTITKISSFSGKGCQFLTSQTLSLGRYLMTVSCLGFEDEKIDFEVTDQDKSKIVLKTISLKEKNNSLNEVTVYGNKKQFIKVESDKTTVNISNNAMLNSGSSLDAVKRLPGVITSPAGGLSLNGKNVTVYVDGSPSTLSGNDLQNYLSSLPANAIDKVELIHNPGAAFDANSNGSIINIVTNSKRLKGVNASFNINYSFNKYQKPAPQILLNGKQKNLSWQTMLGYSYDDAEKRITTEQSFTSFSPAKALFQDKFTVTTKRNVYFRLGTNYKLSSKSNLLFNYNVNFENEDIDYRSISKGEGFVFRDNGITKNKNGNQEASLQYKTKLDTLGKSLEVIGFFNSFNKNPLNKSNTSDNMFNTADLDFGLTNSYLKYDFVLPFEKMNFAVNTGGKYNMIKVNDLGKYNFNKIGRTIDFEYLQNNFAFYVEGRKKIKKLNMTAGLRYEGFNVERLASSVADKVKFKNSNLFPNVSALYEVGPQMNLSASYSKKIQQPSYNTVDPNNNSTFNQYNSSVGNILLKPSFFDNYEFKFTALQFVQLGANYTVAKDESQYIFNAKPGELVSNESFQSFDKMKTFSAFFSFPVPIDYFFKGKKEFDKRMNAIDKMNYIYFHINYIKTKIDGYDFPYTNKAIVNWGMQSQILLPWDITNVMSYSILPKGTWIIYQIENPIHQFDISFNKDFINKKLKMGLHCFDVFNSSETNALVSGENLNTDYHQKKDSRTFRISLTYNFGNLKLEKENTEIKNEKIKQNTGL